MRVLVVTPIKRAYGSSFLFPAAHESIYQLEWRYGGIDHYSPNGGDDKLSHPVADKYRAAQDVFLRGEWDYLLCAESDMIVPRDGLQRLADLNTDIAYGLYCWRESPKEWNAYLSLGVKEGKSITSNPDAARDAWGKVIETAGVGQGFTLIKRHVLETIEFRGRVGAGCDWNFAIDAQYHKFTQLCDLSVVCGHIHHTKVLYPDPTQPDLYRADVNVY